MAQRKAITGVAAILLAGLSLGLASRLDPPGYPSQRNFDRIEKGMDLEQVERLLGPGEQIRPTEAPGVPPYAKFPDSPDGCYGVVWGDHFFRWRDGEDAVLVGFSNGTVASKYRWWEHAW